MSTDIPAGYGIPLVNRTTGLLPSATMTALDARYAGGGDPEQIAAAIEAYLAENPIEGVTAGELAAALTAIELTPGPEGDPGPAGPQNLFVQSTNPNMTDPGLWIDTSGGNVTFWIEDGL